MNFKTTGIRNPKDTDRNRRKRVRQGRLSLRNYLDLPEIGHKILKALEKRTDELLKKAAEVTALEAGSDGEYKKTT